MPFLGTGPGADISSWKTWKEPLKPSEVFRKMLAKAPPLMDCQSVHCLKIGETSDPTEVLGTRSKTRCFDFKFYVFFLRYMNLKALDGYSFAIVRNRTSPCGCAVGVGTTTSIVFYSTSQSGIDGNCCIDHYVQICLGCSAGYQGFGLFPRDKLSRPARSCFCLYN